MSPLPAPTSLDIHLLGIFRSKVDGAEVEERRWSRRKSKLLVKLLALEPRHQLHREQIIDLLWSEQDTEAATSNFNNILYAARRALEPSLASRAESRFITTQGQQVILRAPGKLWIDVDAFEQRAAEAFKSGDAGDYEGALALYEGDLLVEDLYADWASARRESLRLKQRKLLLKLAEIRERAGQFEHGIRRLEELVAGDETDEEAQRRLMRLYALNGARTLALRQYAQFCDALRRDLDATPERATVELYEQIVAGKIHPVASRVVTVAGDERTRRAPVADAAHEAKDADDLNQAKPANQTNDEKDADGGRPPSVAGERINVAASVKSGRGNLPQPLTSFVGRERELKEIKGALSATRLLTLAGGGGMGKTRLALRVAADVRDEYTDGVWLAELAALASPALVAQSVAAMLGVRCDAGEPVPTTLADFLRHKTLMLVLDNCEHLVEACAPLVETLLRACPNLRVLSTSREALGIAGETVWRVPSLVLPDSEDAPDAATVVRNEAVQLFVERARLSAPDFQVTEQNAPPLAQLCRRLDGIPLAIELAAARVKVLSVEQMLLKLDDRFRLLTGGSRTALPRQQTLRATLDWSYNLLSEPERVVLQRLSVFAGGCNLEAAEVVCAGDAIEDGAVLDLLTRLFDKSFVPVATEGAESRYRMLETIREYASEKLRAGQEEETALKSRHGDWFLRLAEQAETGMWKGDAGEWLKRLEAEHDNFRAALDWFKARGEIDAGLRMAGALWRFWEVRGYLNEGRRWLETLLASERDVQASPLVRAKALMRAGALVRDQGDYVRAVALLEEGFALYRQEGDWWGAAAALNGLGDAAHQQGDYTRATRCYEESLSLFTELGDKRATGYLLHNLGNVAKEETNYRRATTLHEEALALFHQVGDRRAASYSLFNLGEVAMYDGDLPRAAALHKEALAIKQELGDKRGVAFSLNSLGDIARLEGDHLRAATFYEQSLALSREIGDKRSLAFCLEGLAETICARGADAERAARLFGAAETLRQVIGAPLPRIRHADYDRCLAALRATLDAETFQAALAHGRQMSVEQAVALALAPLTRS